VLTVTWPPLTLHTFNHGSQGSVRSQVYRLGLHLNITRFPRKVCVLWNPKGWVRGTNRYSSLSVRNFELSWWPILLLRCFDLSWLASTNLGESVCGMYDGCPTLLLVCRTLVTSIISLSLSEVDCFHALWNVTFLRSFYVFYTSKSCFKLLLCPSFLGPK
jgi:hypothetical protein